MKNNAKMALAVILVIVGIVGMAWAGFWIQRTWNYNMYYKSQVEQQVNRILEQRVSQECLVKDIK